MSNIKYIGEEAFLGAIEAEAKKTSREGKVFILNPAGFSRHLIGVGNNAEAITQAILKRHPTLRSFLSPDIARVAGFMHDFAKFSVGDPYHEIDGAYAILTMGEELGLVEGGSEEERRRVLRRMAACLPSDGVVYEQLGDNPPQTAIYPGFFTPEMARRLEVVRRGLSADGRVLTIEELAAPAGLEQKVVMYADFKNLEGAQVSLRDRLKEIEGRYNALAEKVGEEEVAKFRVVAPEVTREEVAYSWSSVPALLNQTATRTITIFGTVDELLSDSA